MTESYIKQNEGGTLFAGPDATALFYAAGLKHAISLYVKHKIKASRMHTPTNMRAAASRITHKYYGRGQAGLVQAMVDLDAWCEEMRSRLPVKREG